MTSTKVLALAAALSLASLPAIAQSNAMDTTTSDVNTQQSGAPEAIHMVPARAALLQTLDANKTASGAEFSVRLASTVHLDNGPKLPTGTTLIGNVVQDDSSNRSANNGTSSLTVRFTQARLKDGTVVPIKATIVGVARSSDYDSSGYPMIAGDQEPNGWADGTMKVDEIDVVSHVDMHSQIASNNSGVFVASDNRDIKLGVGSELELAIAQRQNDVPQEGGN